MKGNAFSGNLSIQMSVFVYHCYCANSIIDVQNRVKQDVSSLEKSVDVKE